VHDGLCLWEVTKHLASNSDRATLLQFVHDIPLDKLSGRRPSSVLPEAKSQSLGFRGLGQRLWESVRKRGTETMPACQSVHTLPLPPPTEAQASHCEALWVASSD
jgi:hypothetical protein